MIFSSHQDVFSDYRDIYFSIEMRWTIDLQVEKATSPSEETACPVEGGGWKNVLDYFIEVRSATWG